MNFARSAILVAVAACSSKATIEGTAQGKFAVSTAPACRDAYADYEAKWRLARTEELAELGDEDVAEEILYHELATLPSRAELGELRDIYAVVDAFLWDAPWPRALEATGKAIERCGEKTARPPA